jgi:hypothetical protein
MGAAKAITGAALLATTALGIAPQATAELRQVRHQRDLQRRLERRVGHDERPVSGRTERQEHLDRQHHLLDGHDGAGKVTSTLGWTEDIYTMSGAQWFVKHYVPDWIPCPDGSTSPGLQVYRFYPATESGNHAPAGTPVVLMVGEDQTTGQSGNCGRNKSLVLTLPVKMTKLT